MCAGLGAGGDSRSDQKLRSDRIDTLDGIPDYGPIQVSFTTTGDTGGNLLPDGLDLSRFPVAGRSGVVSDQRTIAVPDNVAQRLADMHVVVHGHDLNGNGSYDGALSSLSSVIGATGAARGRAAGWPGGPSAGPSATSAESDVDPSRTEEPGSRSGSDPGHQGPLASE